MTLFDCIHAAGYTKRFKRKSWTHADVMYIYGNKQSYGGGELMWQYAGTRATLCYARDLIAEDWELVD